MTINEFKAWLDGFSAAIDGAPTPEQWDTIRAKLATAGQAATPLPDYLRTPFTAPTYPSPGSTGWPLPGNVWCGGSANTNHDEGTRCCYYAGPQN